MLGLFATGILIRSTFILLNLVFSTQAAYAAPLVLMGQNRSSEHDRLRAEEAYRTAAETKAELMQLRAEHAEFRAELIARLSPDKETRG